MTVKLSPIGNDAVLDSSGNPAVNWKWYTYAAGTTTAQSTYTDNTGNTAHANPIVLNARGEPATSGGVAAPIWLTTGLSYKFVLKTDLDVTIRSIDNVTGVNDSTLTLDEWVASALTPTYVSTTSFTVPGDQTSTFTVGRRLKLTVTAGTVYGTITVSTYTSLTTITVLLDSGTLDSGLSAVQLGLLTTTHSSIPPTIDSSPVVVGSADLSKKLRIEVDGLTTATTRVAYAPDYDFGLGYGFGAIHNATFTVTMAASAVTVALKTKAGADPSATDPVFVVTRNVSATSGTYNVRQITAALSVVISSGSTLGTVSAIPSRVWISFIDNAGTIELAVYNSVSATQGNIFALAEEGFISTTAEGGAGAADSAATWYSTTARTNVSFRLAAFFESTQATAGTWASAATKIQLFGPGVHIPGDVVQQVYTTTGIVATGSTAIPADNTIPQITEGDQFLSLAFTPTAAANKLIVDAQGLYGNASNVRIQQCVFRDAVANALGVSASVQSTGLSNLVTIATHCEIDAGTTNATTLRVRAGSTSGTTSFNGENGSQLYGGVLNSYIKITEIMV